MASSTDRKSIFQNVFNRNKPVPQSASEPEEMTMKEVLTLSPWQKFRKYGRLPAKLVLHIALMIILVLQIVFVFQQFTLYDRNSRITFLNAFTNPNVSNGIATVQDTLSTISWTVSTFYSFPGESVGLFTFTNATDENGILPVYMKVKGSNVSGIYPLNESDSLGPFNNVDASQIQLWFADIEAITLTFEYANVNYGPYGPRELYMDPGGIYHVRLTDTEQGGLVNYNVLVNRRVVGKARSLVIFTLLDIVVLATCLVSLFLTVRVIINRTKLFMMTRDFFKRLPPATLRSFKYHSWDDIPLGVKLGFYSFWSATSIVANLALIGATLMNLFSAGYQVNSTGYFVLYSMGVLLTFVNLLRYMEYYEKFYILITTLKLAFPRVVRTILSALPIFFGYVLVGVILFSPFSERFQNFDHTSVTLFALINGDEIMATFGELSEVYPHLVISRIYLYTFIALFITAVLNIFIFIIEDAFKAAKILGKDPAAVKRKRLEKIDLKKLLDMIEEQLAEEDPRNYPPPSSVSNNSTSLNSSISSTSSLLGATTTSKKAPARYRFSRVVKKVMEQNASNPAGAATSLSTSMMSDAEPVSRKDSAESNSSVNTGAVPLKTSFASATFARGSPDDLKRPLLPKEEKEPAKTEKGGDTPAPASLAPAPAQPKLRLSQMFWGPDTTAAAASTSATPRDDPHVEPVSPRSHSPRPRAPESKTDAAVMQTVLQNQQAFMADFFEETEHLKEKYMSKLRVDLEQLLNPGSAPATHSINFADE